MKEDYLDDDTQDSSKFFSHLPFQMLQAFLPSMKERNHGHIVAMSSMAGLIGFKNLVPYCGTKFAVRGVMEALENELFDETEGNSKVNWMKNVYFQFNAYKRHT